MLVKEAKEIARQWVVEQAADMKDFYGAYFAGSTNWKADDSTMPLTSDVDVKFVVADRNLHKNFAKTNVNGVMIDASFSNFEIFRSPETTLVTYYAAKHFTTPNIIFDPTGQLAKVQTAVAENFAKREWVRKRSENAHEWVRTTLKPPRQDDPWSQQVFWWLYPLIIMHHVILVADLKNPTVGGAFIDGKATLTHYGHQQLHEQNLRLLGSERFSTTQAMAHLAALTEMFDVAKTYVRTPFFGSTNIQEDAPAIAIDHSQQEIQNEYHREALFWIASHMSWCQTVLHNDAPKEVQQRFAPAYQHLLSDLGIPTLADIERRLDEARDFLPRLWEVAEDIMARNPQIQD